ncbi:MAG: PHP domain-containing protein, partial [Solirubrobacterales bacterium]|nr:PHP domain-containing protein [Solirubrobacterales bacterium]
MVPTSDGQRYVDLHVHTTWSDGRWTPRQVVAEAAALDLAAIAVTDHDVLGGLAEAEVAARELGVEILAGVELTADWDGRTVHILGYGINPEHERLRAALERGRQLMGDHVDRVLSAVRAAGENLTVADLGKYRARYAGGASLVLAMVERGVLKRAANGAALLRLATREPRAYTAVEAIGLIHGAGGAASLAHPVRIRRDRPLLDATDLAPLAAAGLDAIEVWQIVHGRAERQHYAAVADELDLLV